MVVLVVQIMLDLHTIIEYERGEDGASISSDAVSCGAAAKAT